MTKPDLWADVTQLVAEVRQMGASLGLPYVGAQSDIGDPEAMSDADGRPYAETSFTWVDPLEPYWRNRRLALESPFINAARLCSEPICFHDDRLTTWRGTHLLDGIDVSKVRVKSEISGAIITPAHLPLGRIGAVIWGARDAIDTLAIFEEHASRLFALSMRFLAAHAEASRKRTAVAQIQLLTRREVQCLRWAASGKTNAEIGIILTMSVSTVRFHLRNAAQKLGVGSRGQAIQIAAGHGFVGDR
ncbi:MAG: response regulator transcription factor [Sphingopyxis sp.]